MGSNAAEGASRVTAAHPDGQGKQNRANVIVFDPRFTRTARVCPPNMCALPRRHRYCGDLGHHAPHLRQRLGRQAVHCPARCGHGSDPRRSRQVDSRRSGTAVTGIPGEQLKKVAETFAKEKPATFIWCMGGTQHTVGTANVRAYCNLLLATGKRRRLRHWRKHSSRGHTNVQGATDLGLDIGTLPLSTTALSKAHGVTGPACGKSTTTICSPASMKCPRRAAGRLAPASRTWNCRASRPRAGSTPSATLPMPSTRRTT